MHRQDRKKASMGLAELVLDAVGAFVLPIVCRWSEARLLASRLSEQRRGKLYAKSDEGSALTFSHRISHCSRTSAFVSPAPLSFSARFLRSYLGRQPSPSPIQGLPPAARSTRHWKREASTHRRFLYSSIEPQAWFHNLVE